MINLKNIFRKKRPSITLTFSPDGLRCINVQMGKSINATAAIDAIANLRVDLYRATLQKAKDHGLRQPGDKQRGWIAAQKIGDVL